MNRDAGSDTQARFGGYVADLASVLGHVDRIGHSRTTVSVFCRRRAARASSRWRQ